jgi:tripartite-type tricarboxylate transporter receptor subunit TctC
MATAIFGCCPFEVAGKSWAGSYPQRPVKIVVAGLPGVPFDLLARALADKLSVTFKQPFVVENRPGAGGNLGAEAVARSVPDGHTMLMSLSSTFTVNPSVYKNLPFDPSADFRFLTLGARAPNMLVVHPSVPVNSLSELVAYAKKEPIAYAHGGPGTPGHLCMEYFRLLAGFQTMPVAYRGNTQLSADLAAGQIKFGFVGTGGIIGHVRAGRLKGLAISSRQRSPLAPDVPSISELGYPEFEFNVYFPLSVPADTPEEIVALLERAARDALRSPELQERFVPLDVAIVASSGAEAKSRIESEARLWAKVVKEADMHVD